MDSKKKKAARLFRLYVEIERKFATFPMYLSTFLPFNPFFLLYLRICMHGEWIKKCNLPPFIPFPLHLLFFSLSLSQLNIYKIVQNCFPSPQAALFSIHASIYVWSAAVPCKCLLAC